MNLAEKRNEEKKIMAKMVGLYCRGHRHGAAKGLLCPHCAQLLAYANQRTEHCPRTGVKTFCSKCPIQCYEPSMRAQVRAVMRYAGPRLLWHSPVLVLKHVLAPKEKCKRQAAGAKQAPAQAGEKPQEETT